MKPAKPYTLGCLLILFCAMLAAAMVVGWLVNGLVQQSPLWAGILIGICPGGLLGILAGILIVAGWAQSDPEKFLAIFKGKS
jgi:hypothetical protein